MAEVPVLQEQQTGRPPWMAEVPVLQEQQTGSSPILGQPPGGSAWVKGES